MVVIFCLSLEIPASEERVKTKAKKLTTKLIAEVGGYENPR
jgi:hypothetical protein